MYLRLVGKGLHHISPHQIKMADAADGVIPVVDFGIMGLNCQNPPSLDEDSVKLLAEKIYTAFSTIGFVYLTKHGISDAEVSVKGVNRAVQGGPLARFTIGKIANHG